MKTQIWTAISIYVLAAIVKKRLNLEASLYTLLQFISVSLFEKNPLNLGFLDNIDSPEGIMFRNQLNSLNS